MSIMSLQAPETSYYIPFTKKNVDEIIANSANTDKFGIRYVVKFGSEDATEGMHSLRGTSLVMICSYGPGINCTNGRTGLRIT